MLNIPTKKKPARLQFQIPHDLKLRVDLLVKHHKANGIALGMDTLVEYLLGRMLDEAPELADFRAYEESAAKTEAEEPFEQKDAMAQPSDKSVKPAQLDVQPAAPVRSGVSTLPPEDASEIAKKEMARRASSTVNTLAE